MRLRFSDIKVLREIARHEVMEGMGKLKNWWSKKYSLPCNHELFLTRSIGSLSIEMYSDLYIKRDELEDSLKELSGKEADLVVKQINDINASLEDGEYFTTDPLIDKWEKELEAGLTPDLSER